MQNSGSTVSQQSKFVNLFTSIFSATGKKNTITSPLSIASCLAMVAEGSSGQSFQELKEVFGFESEAQVYGETMQKALTALHKAENQAVIVKMCNLLYVNKNAPLRPEFVQSVITKHWATAENVDFSDPTLKDRINQKISESTNDLIKNCISSLSPALRTVLVNTIYFKGLWKNQFEKDSTYPDAFNKEDGSTVQADFMNSKMDAGYHETASAKYLSLAYKGDQIKMVIELPTSRSLGKVDIEAVLHASTLFEEKVFVALPKFKIEFKCEEILDLLKILGVQGIINGVGLEKMSDSPVAISQVIHQAFIQVDEEGTEAAAATIGFGITCVSEGEGPKEFRADSPFFFHIVDSENQITLFSGAVQEPKFETK